MKHFHPLRILVMLLILIGVAIYVQEQRLSTTSWTEQLEVVLYPVSADGSIATEQYIDALKESDFESVTRFLSREARRYDLILKEPFRITLGATPEQRPPDPPRPEDSIFRRLGWSLQFRIWAWRHTPDEASNFRRIRVFVVYHPREDRGSSLPHSVGIQKGLLGLVHAYAHRESAAHNNIVLAHEILHTVGATDKYSEDGQPKIPEGLANPDRVPLFPQTRAEIMAGYIARSQSEFYSPFSLRQCVIGPITAREIGWLWKG